MQGADVATGVVATGKHLVGHGLAEGGLNQAPAHVGSPRAARRAAAAVRGGGPRRRPRLHDARLLRRRRPPVPRVGGAADLDPAPRVGVRRDRRVRLHRGPDAGRAAPPDRRPGHRGLDGAAGRDGQRAADVGGLRGAAQGGHRRRPDRPRLRRPRRRAQPAAQVPARPVRAARTSTCRRSAMLDQIEAEEQSLARGPRPAVDRAARERRRAAAGRRDGRHRRHRADRGQRAAT